eukprot:gene5040-10098_t
MTSNVSVDCEFISGSVNTASNAIVWEILYENSLQCIAYSISNLIAIVDPQLKVIICTLRGHSGLINMLTSIKDINGILTDLVSCSTDGSVRVWSHQIGTDILSWTESSTLLGLKGSVIALNSTFSVSGSVIVASDETGQIMIWRRASTSSTFASIGKLQLPMTQMPKEILLVPIFSNSSKENDNAVVIVFGCLDSRIRVRLLQDGDMNNNDNNDTNKSDSSNTLTSIGKELAVLAGHDDWIRCMCVTSIAQQSLSSKEGQGQMDSKPSISFLIASGSQDSKIRLWKIAPTRSSIVIPIVNSASILEDDEDELEEGDDDGDAQGILPVEETVGDFRASFETSGSTWAISLEAILVGHEDWVTSVHWLPSKDAAVSNDSLRLFSTSMDRNMVLWSADEQSGVWLPMFRMGDIGGSIGGAVGSNLLGFVGGCVSPDGHDVMGIGFGGAFHLWNRTRGEKNDSTNSGSSNVITGVGEGEDVVVPAMDAVDATGSWIRREEQWRPASFLTGHFREVTDLCWHSRHESPCLVTVSSDQTCRLVAPLLAKTIENNKLTKSKYIWRELSRPQIHGYDINAVALSMNPMNGSCYLFSAADEKVIRVLESPVGVSNGLRRLCNIDLDIDLGGGNGTRGGNTVGDGNGNDNEDTNN